MNESQKEKPFQMPNEFLHQVVEHHVNQLCQSPPVPRRQPGRARVHTIHTSRAGSSKSGESVGKDERTFLGEKKKPWRYILVYSPLGQYQIAKLIQIKIKFKSKDICFS